MTPDRATVLHVLGADLPDLSGPVRALRAGELVVFPTETVYGLGANALDAGAVARIFAAKGRPAGNPLIVHVADPAGGGETVAMWTQAAQTLADAFWPGPLTLVLPKHERVPAIVTAGGATVAVRCPDHPVARALISLAGVPVAAPSANPSGAVSATRVAHLAPSVVRAASWILDAGPCRGGIESTVLDLTTTVPTVLRPGLISRDSLSHVIGRVDGPANRAAVDAARSPGLVGRHYAPSARVVLVDGAPLPARPVRLSAWLTSRRPPRAPERVRIVDMPETPEAYARVLYDALQRLDAEHIETVFVDMPPETAEWEAIRDRLRRAALG